MTSQTLRNHFRVAKDATKHVQLPICSESTGLVVLQWFNRFALTIV